MAGWRFTFVGWAHKNFPIYKIMMGLGCVCMYTIRPNDLVLILYQIRLAT